MHQTYKWELGNYQRHHSCHANASILASIRTSTGAPTLVVFSCGHEIDYGPNEHDEQHRQMFLEKLFDLHS